MSCAKKKTYLKRKEKMIIDNLQNNRAEIGIQKQTNKYK